MEKRKKHTKKYWRGLSQRLMIAGGFLILPIIFVAFYANSHGPIAQAPLTASPTYIMDERPQSTIGLPIKLKIPKIKVDAVIKYSGLTTDGAMAIEKNPDEVAWYQFGPRPGEIGSAVIAGHYGFLNGNESVFNKLRTLGPGDKIQVIDEAGITVNFVVKRSQKYDPDADASEIFKSNDGTSHLNLITCDGAWDNTQQTYSDRLVIFTDKEVVNK